MVVLGRGVSDVSSPAASVGHKQVLLTKSLRNQSIQQSYNGLCGLVVAGNMLASPTHESSHGHVFCTAFPTTAGPTEVTKRQDKLRACGGCCCRERTACQGGVYLYRPTLTCFSCKTSAQNSHYFTGHWQVVWPRTLGRWAATKQTCVLRVCCVCVTTLCMHKTLFMAWRPMLSHIFQNAFSNPNLHAWLSTSSRSQPTSFLCHTGSPTPTHSTAPIRTYKTWSMRRRASCSSTASSWTRAAALTLAQRTPRTGEVFTVVAEAQAEDVDLAVQAARRVSGAGRSL